MTAMDVVLSVSGFLVFAGFITLKTMADHIIRLLVHTGKELNDIRNQNIPLGTIELHDLRHAFARVLVLYTNYAQASESSRTFFNERKTTAPDPNQPYKNVFGHEVDYFEERAGPGNLYSTLSGVSV